MLILKKGFPEESEIVLCTVTKIHYHSVFVTLDEYETRQGMIHISEISPGRIRNLGDYVSEGKKIVCKVLSINRDRGHIDLSLRRVSQVQKRTKVDEIKQEQKAEKIIEFVASQNDMKTLELLSIIKSKINDEFDTLHDAFSEVVESDYEVAKFGVDGKVAKDLEDVIRQRIKPVKVEISGEITLQTFASNGLSIIKECLNETLKVSDELDIFYLGGGRYAFKIVTTDFKTAEGILKDAVDYMESFMSKHNGLFSYKREEGKKTTG